MVLLSGGAKLHTHLVSTSTGGCMQISSLTWRTSLFLQTLEPMTFGSSEFIEPQKASVLLKKFLCFLTKMKLHPFWRKTICDLKNFSFLGSVHRSLWRVNWTEIAFCGQQTIKSTAGKCLLWEPARSVCALVYLCIKLRHTAPAEWKRISLLLQQKQQKRISLLGTLTRTPDASSWSRKSWNNWRCRCFCFIVLIIIGGSNIVSHAISRSEREREKERIHSLLGIIEAACLSVRSCVDPQQTASGCCPQTRPVCNQNFFSVTDQPEICHNEHKNPNRLRRIIFQPRFSNFPARNPTFSALVSRNVRFYAAHVGRVPYGNVQYIRH